MSQPTNLATMHQDHQTWVAENNNWRDDARAWEDEFKAVLAALPAVHDALSNQLRKLQTHAAAVRLYEQEMTAHERRLAENARNPKTSDLPRDHEQERLKHSQLREDHEAFKDHHRTILGHWAALLKALDESE